MTNERKAVLITGLAAIGNVAGIIVAVKRKSGFWGGVGWFLLGGLAGGGIGYITAAVIPDSKELTVTEDEDETKVKLSL